MAAFATLHLIYSVSLFMKFSRNSNIFYVNFNNVCIIKINLCATETKTVRTSTNLIFDAFKNEIKQIHSFFSLFACDTIISARRYISLNYTASCLRVFATHNGSCKHIIVQQNFDMKCIRDMCDCGSINNRNMRVRIRKRSLCTLAHHTLVAIPRSEPHGLQRFSEGQTRI